MTYSKINIPLWIFFFYTSLNIFFLSLSLTINLEKVHHVHGLTVIIPYQLWDGEDELMSLAVEKIQVGVGVASLLCINLMN